MYKIHNSFKGQGGLYQLCRNVWPYREDQQSEGFVYGALACWVAIILAWTNQVNLFTPSTEDKGYPMRFTWD